MFTIGGQLSPARLDGNLGTLRRDLEYLVGFELDAAEIPVHGLDVIRNGRLHRPTVLAVRRILEDFPFDYSVHAPNRLNLMDRDRFELHVAVIEATLEFAAEIGALTVVCHPGRYLPEEAFATSVGTAQVAEDEKKRLLEREAAILKNLAGEFPEIVIALENARPYRVHSPYCYAERPAELKAQVRRIGRDNVRITLDTGHLHMAARHYGFDPVAEVAQLAGLIAHCHVHDNFGAAHVADESDPCEWLPFGRGDLHLPVGWGVIDFARLFSGILPDYEGTLILAHHRRFFRHLGESAAILARIAARCCDRVREG